MNNSNNSNNNDMWIGEVIGGAITTIFGLIFSCICGWIFIKGADTVTKVVIIPFLICGITVLIRGIVSFKKGLNIRKGLNDSDISAEEVFNKHDKLNIADKIFSKLYIVGFLLFWFGFLIVFDYIAIRDGQMEMLLFSLIFWAAGIWVAIKNFKG